MNNYDDAGAMLELNQRILGMLEDTVAKQSKEIKQFQIAVNNARNSFKEIARGESAFSLDQLTHAFNCIENAKRISIAWLETNPE